MNRTFVLTALLVLLIVFSTAAITFAETNWVPFNGATPPQKPSAVVLSSNANETTVKITVTGFWSQNLIEDGIAYQALKFPGYATTLDVGKPGMPVVSELIGIPGSANVSVSVIDYKEVTLGGYTVYPFQTPLKETEKRVTFDIDRALYQQNAYYPEVQASIGAPGIWRDLRVLNLRVSPFQYNPATSELRACHEITVKLEYTGTSDVNVKGSLTRRIAPNYDRMYRQGVLNYSQMNLEVSGEVDAAYDYLIIADDAYMSAMTPFVDWKTTQGLATSIVPVSIVGSDYSAIKSYIDAEYVNNGISYVLLVGNENDIPGYTDYGFFSDYYYTLLEGSDDYAELAIGRFCVDNPTQLGNMVTKSVTFESTPPAGDWLTKSLLVANQEEAPGKYQECKEQIRTAEETGGVYSILYPDFNTAYGALVTLGGDEATNADVVAYFNEGFRLVNYRGHGDQTTWQIWNYLGEYFEISDVNAIDNGQMTPVVFSIACLNADLAFAGTTIAEAFTQGDDGAVAYLGASYPSYTFPNHDYDKQLYMAVFDQGVNAVGDASNQASVETILLWGSLGITNARMYLWLGDPSLQLIFEGSIGPPSPILLSPAEGAYFNLPTPVLLDWTDVPEAAWYNLRIDNDPDFSSPLIEQEGVTESEWTTPELGEGIYYWSVQSEDESSNEGPFSRSRWFSVMVNPSPVVLVAPGNEEKIRNAPGIPMQWFEAAGRDDYRIEIDNNVDFSSPEQTGNSATCVGGICTYYIGPPLMPGSYYWRVRVDEAIWPWSEVWSFRLQGRVKKDSPETDGLVPGKVVLNANYPNPFNPTTEICFGLPAPGYVRLEIFNIKGQKMTTLVDGSLEAGYHTYTWNGKDAASGVYLYRLITDENVIARKMLLVK